jgi:hypothetical protein
VEGADEPKSDDNAQKRRQVFPISENTTTTFLKKSDDDNRCNRLHFVPTPECPSLFPSSHKLNRKEANAVRKQFKAFKAFYVSTFMLCDGKIEDAPGTAPNLHRHRAGSWDRHNEIIALAGRDPSDPDILDYYMQATRLLAPPIYYYYLTSADSVASRLKAGLVFFDQLILYSHSAIVYEQIVVKDGTIPKDPLAKLRRAVGY